jgi:hypothetical protein
MFPYLLYFAQKQFLLSSRGQPFPVQIYRFQILKQLFYLHRQVDIVVALSRHSWLTLPDQFPPVLVREILLYVFPGQQSHVFWSCVIREFLRGHFIRAIGELLLVAIVSAPVSEEFEVSGRKFAINIMQRFYVENLDFLSTLCYLKNYFI